MVTFPCERNFVEFDNEVLGSKILALVSIMIIMCHQQYNLNYEAVCHHHHHPLLLTKFSEAVMLLTCVQRCSG
jgi:hypothetical protein